MEHKLTTVQQNVKNFEKLLPKIKDYKKKIHSNFHNASEKYRSAKAHQLESWFNKMMKKYGLKSHGHVKHATKGKKHHVIHLKLKGHNHTMHKVHAKEVKSKLSLKKAKKSLNKAKHKLIKFKVHKKKSHKKHHIKISKKGKHAKKGHHAKEGHHAKKGHHLKIGHHLKKGHHLKIGHHVKKVHHVKKGHHVKKVHVKKVHAKKVHHVKKGKHARRDAQISRN